MADKTEKVATSSESKAAPSGVTRRKPSNIPKIFASKDAAQVQASIRNVYGHNVSAAFANDLIAFVEKAMRGDYSGERG